MPSFSNTYFFILLAVVAGMLLPTQAAVNNRLAESLQSPVLSAFVSFAVGTAALFLYMLAAGVPFGNLLAAREAPPAAWTGGLLGAFFVTAIVVLVPRLGVALAFGLVVAGQMLAALVIDHFGLLGVQAKEINLARLAGVTLVTLGVVLIRKF